MFNLQALTKNLLNYACLMYKSFIDKFVFKLQKFVYKLILQQLTIYCYCKRK